MGRKRDGSGQEERRVPAEYYRLNTKAVDDLVTADESNSPEVSREELNKYRSGPKIRLRDWVKAFLIKWWFAGAVCFFFLYVYLKAEEENKVKLLGMAIAGVIMTFILLGKVFSSQYLIWAISPIVLILMFEEDMFKSPLFKFTAAAFIMTQVEFVYNIGILGGGSNINDFGMIIILIRNILTVVMLYLIVRGMYDILKEGAQKSDVV